MATAGDDRNSASEDGCPVERALIANEMMLYSEQDKVLPDTVIVLIPSKKIIIFLETMYKKKILYGGIIMGVIKEGVLTEAGSIIRTLTVSIPK